MNIGWPEGIMLGCMALGFCAKLAEADTVKGMQEFIIHVAATGITLALLWWGGFFA